MRNTRTFSPGFRLSRRDVAVLIIGAAGAASLMRFDSWIALAVVFVVVHFFLFCNVLRMSRLPELIWAVSFSGLAIMASVFHMFGWPWVFGISIAITILLAVIESRRARYHGVGWKRLNPELPDWWAAHYWDEQFESDVDEGRLDALASEALQDAREGRATEL